MIGNVESRVKLLKEIGRDNLAYITASIHGVAVDDADLVDEEGNPRTMPSLPRNPFLLYPPTPLLRQEDLNWPVLTGESFTHTHTHTHTLTQNYLTFLSVTRGLFDVSSKGDVTSRMGGFADEMGAEGEEEGGEGGGWGDDIHIPEEGREEEGEGEGDGEEGEEKKGGGEGEGWDDLDIPDVEEGEGGREKERERAGGVGGMVVPHAGPPLHQVWCKMSSLPVDHVAAGTVLSLSLSLSRTPLLCLKLFHFFPFLLLFYHKFFSFLISSPLSLFLPPPPFPPGSFESAMALMNNLAGIVNFAPLKPAFLSHYSASRIPVTGYPSSPSFTLYLQKGSENLRSSHPIVTASLQSQIDRLKGAYRATFEGKFSEALALFQSIAQSLLFVSVSSQQEVGHQILNSHVHAHTHVKGLRTFVLMLLPLAGDGGEGVAGDLS